MFQLIQYTPSTSKVFKKPLLIVPPWINKFYILDLRPENSLIKYAVDQGHTVFVISWANPDASYADCGFDTYLDEGLLTALDAVLDITGEKSANITASQEDDCESFYDPLDDKPYRHATHYQLPDAVNNM